MGLKIQTAFITNSFRGGQGRGISNALQTLAAAIKVRVDSAVDHAEAHKPLHMDIFPLHSLWPVVGQGWFWNKKTKLNIYSKY